MFISLFPHAKAHIYNLSNSSVIMNGAVSLPAPIIRPFAQVSAGTPELKDEGLNVYTALELTILKRLTEYIAIPGTIEGAKLINVGAPLDTFTTPLLNVDFAILYCARQIPGNKNKPAKSIFFIVTSKPPTARAFGGYSLNAAPRTRRSLWTSRRSACAAWCRSRTRLRPLE